MTNSDDYKAWAAQQKAQAVHKTGAVLSAVSATNPDAYAGDVALGKAFNVPTGVAAAGRDMLSGKLQAMQRDMHISSSPMVMNWLQNQDNASVAHDDLNSLTWFEGFAKSAVNVAKRTGNRLSQINHQMDFERINQQRLDHSKTYSDILEEVKLDGHAGGGYIDPWRLLNATWRYGTSRGVVFNNSEEMEKDLLSSIAEDKKAIEAAPMSTTTRKFLNDWKGGDTLGQTTSNLFEAISNDPFGAFVALTENGADALPASAAALGVTVASKNPRLGLAVMGGNSYLTERYTTLGDVAGEHGLDLSKADDREKLLNNPTIMKDAASRGAIRGTIIAGLDLLSGGLAGKTLAKNPFAEALAQTFQQAVLGGTGEYAARVAAGQEIDFKDVLMEFVTEMVSTPFDMGTAGHEFATSQKAATNAETAKTQIDALGDQAAASKLRQRPGGKFEEFVAHVTKGSPVENVYVPAEVMQTYFQGMNVNPAHFFAELKLPREDYETALATGGDVMIPTSAYTAKLAGSEFDQTLRENMRFSPDAMTWAEAQEFNARADDALAQAFDEANSLQERENELRSHELKIYDDMVSRLRAAGRSTEVATKEAMIYPAFYRAMAERSGMSIEQFNEMLPLPKVRGEIPEGLKLKNVDELTRTLAAARNPLAQKADHSETLLEWLDRYGGVNDPGGELKARNANIIKRGRGKKTLKIARGEALAGQASMLGLGSGTDRHSMDVVAQAALDEGFLSDTPLAQQFRMAVHEGRQTPDLIPALLDAIEEELRGNPHKRSGGDSPQTKEDIEGYLAGLGVSLSDPDEVIRKAIEQDQAAGGQTYEQSGKSRNIITGPDGRSKLFDIDLAGWKIHLAKLRQGTAKLSVLVMRQNFILEALVTKRSNIVIDPVYAQKVMAKHPDVPQNVWEKLPELLADPLAAFHHHEGGISFAIDARTAQNEPIVVAVRDGRVRTITPLHNKPNQTGQENLMARIATAISDGHKTYIRSKASFDATSQAYLASRLGMDRSTRRGPISQSGNHSYTSRSSDRRESKLTGKILSREDIIKRQGRLYYQSAQGALQIPEQGIGSGEALITLFEKADLSTFLHESGHFFLSALRHLSAQDNAAPEMLTMQESIRSWHLENASAVASDAIKATGISVTHEDVVLALESGTTGDVLKDHAIDIGCHEQFARGFEAYVMEGKAPSHELRSVFERFRGWLLNLYKTVAGLQVKISHELKSVFDRMLATDEELASAKHSLRDDALFANVADMGLSDSEYEALNTLYAQANDEASHKLLQKTMKPLSREREAWFKREKEAVHKETEDRINKLPVYRCLEWILNKRWLGSDQPIDHIDMRLNRQALIERYGEGVLQTLPKGITSETGLDPDEVFGFFGFNSSDQMIKALETAPPRKEAIQAETDREMYDRHGDPLRDGSVEAEALAAVHSDKRGQFLVAELRALKSLAGDVSPTFSAQAMREVARRTLNSMTVKDAVKSSRFLSAERKASRQLIAVSSELTRRKAWAQKSRRDVMRAVRGIEGGKAEQAIASVNTKIEAANQKAGRSNATTYEAIKLSERRLLNHMLYAESLKLAYEVEAAERYTTRLKKAVKKARLEPAKAKISGEYIEPIEAVLEQYAFKAMAADNQLKRAALQAYVDRMVAEGRANELAIPDSILANLKPMPYSTLKVDHLRGVIDTLKNIEHSARTKRKLIDENRQRDLDEVATSIALEFDANIKKKPPSRTASGRSEHLVDQYLNLVKTTDTILREVDGFKDAGAAYSNIKAPVDEAMNNLTVMRHDAAVQFEKLYSVYSRAEQRQMAKLMDVPELGLAHSVSKWDLLSIALNTGNDDNFAKLTDARVKGSFTPHQIEQALKRLDERDWKFVQSAWDMIDSYWPLIEARERRVTGVSPQKIMARPVETPFGTLRGGYYPLKYDGEISGAARDDSIEDLTSQLQGGRKAKAGTRNGHTKERSLSSGRPVKIDISVMHGHIGQVIHDLSLSETVNNSWRVLQDRRVKEAFLEAGRKSDFDTLEVWLKDVASGDVKSSDFMSRFARRVKTGFTVSRLAFNLSTALMQPTGAVQSMVVIGKKNFTLGVMDMFRFPSGLTGAVKSITDRSSFMAERQSTFNKDIYDVMGDVKSGPLASPVSRFMQEVMGPLSFWLMTKTQFYIVDVPTWFGGYRKAIAQGMNENAAAVEADRAVARAQGSGVYSDRSAIERGSLSHTTRQNDVVRLFTTLASYMFSKFNVAYERTKQTDFKDPRSALIWASDMALLFALEAVLAAAIKGRLPDDEDDDGETSDDWAKFLARETAFSVMGTLPFVRDFGSAVQGFNGGGGYGSAMDVLAKPFIAGSKDKLGRTFVKSLVDFGGLFLALPSVQANRMLDAAWREADGDDVSPMEYLLGKRH